MKTRGQLDLRAFNQQLKGSLRPYLLSFVIVMSAVLPAKAVLEGDPELLRMTAMAQKNNRERIDTWQGSSQVEVIYEDSNGVTLHEKSLSDFVFGRQQEATRWKWNLEERYIREEGQLVLDDSAWTKEISNKMTKKDAFYVCEPAFTTKEGERRNTLVIWPVRKARRKVYSYSFDPMWYLTGPMTAGGDDLTEMLMAFYQRANNPEFAPGHTLKVMRDSNLIVFETRNEGIVNRHEFDLSKGGNVVKYYGESNTGNELREWTYEQKDGVWIPKTFTLNINNNTSQPGVLSKRIRKVTFVENTLNHPVDPSEFSLEKLGVRVGMRVSDQKMGLFYLYGGSEKFPLEDEDVFLKEIPAVQAKASVQDTVEEEDNPPTNEPLASDDAISEQPIVTQVEQTRWPNHKKFFIVALVVLPILGLASSVILRKSRKKGVEA